MYVIGGTICRLDVDITFELCHDHLFGIIRGRSCDLFLFLASGVKTLHKFVAKTFLPYYVKRPHNIKKFLGGPHDITTSSSTRFSTIHIDNRNHGSRSH